MKAIPLYSKSISNQGPTHSLASIAEFKCVGYLSARKSPLWPAQHLGAQTKLMLLYERMKPSSSDAAQLIASSTDLPDCVTWAIIFIIVA